MSGDLVEDIKDRLAIDEVIGEYVELKRAGRNLKGLSPFTSEKTPSFMVSPDKQIWHDFSSGKGGSLFNFVMEMEGLDFRGALEYLAPKAGLDITNYRGRSSGADKYKKQMVAALEEAARFYQFQLTKNDEALDYVFKKRGFNKEVVKDFKVGYSPNNGTALTQYLIGKGFEQKLLQDAGLTVVRQSWTGDMFRGRIMIPLMDPQGAVIGFTARQLVTDPDGPKYINTPASRVYDKSRHVYGFSQAKEAIRQSGYVVITEGNLDVISSHQANIRQVVATAGTAMTDAHLKILGRMTNDIRLSFDADEAGLKATERTIALSQNHKLHLSVIDLPEGQDPDDLIREDSTKWLEAINSSVYAPDWLYQRYKQLLNVNGAKGKREFSDIVLGFVSHLNDDVEKLHYLKLLAKDTDTSLEAVQAKMRKFVSSEKSKPKKLKQAKVETANIEPDGTVLEDQFLGLLLTSPTSRRVLAGLLTEPDFEREGRQEIFTFVSENSQTKVNDSNIPQGLKKYEEYVKLQVLIAEELYGEFDANEKLREASELANKLVKNNQKLEKNNLILQLKQAEEAGDDKKVASILAKISALH